MHRKTEKINRGASLLLTARRTTSQKGRRFTGFRAPKLAVAKPVPSLPVRPAHYRPQSSECYCLDLAPAACHSPRCRTSELWRTTAPTFTREAR